MGTPSNRSIASTSRSSSGTAQGVEASGKLRSRNTLAPHAKRRRMWELSRSSIESKENSPTRCTFGSLGHLDLRRTKSLKNRSSVLRMDRRPTSNQATAKPIAGTAMAYAIKHHNEFGPFLETAQISLDRNAADRAPRIVAIGHSTFLFAGHSKDAQNLVILDSIVGACRMHGGQSLATLTLE